MTWTLFGDVLNRRWRSMIVSGAITLTLALLALRAQPADYHLELRYIVGQPPLQSTLTDEQERYYTWVTSEYVVFSISDWVNGTAFFEMLLGDLRAQGFDVDLDELNTMLGSTSYRSILLVEMKHPNRELIEAAAAATTAIVTSLPDVDIPQLRLAPPVLFPVDTVPAIEAPAPSIIDQLQIPLSIVLALAAAMVTTFWLERADSTIRSRRAAARLKLPILGEIPASV